MECQALIGRQCGHVVGIDAGHLKEERWQGYVCLVACSIDGDRRNQMLAFAIVPSESQQSYDFFIDSMLNSGLRDFLLAYDLVCLSDRGKALLASLRASLPGAHRRNCSQHLLQHFTADLKKGSIARTHYDTIVFSHERSECDASMAYLRTNHSQVASKLEEIGLQHVAESYMPDAVRTYSQRTNNLAEQRMAWLQDLRRFSPVPLLVEMLLKLNTSYENQMKALQKAKQDNLIVTSYATQRFNDAMDKAKLYGPVRLGTTDTFHVRKKFQVATGKGSIDEARTVCVTKDLMQVGIIACERPYDPYWY
jgi:ribonucleotide monophosphatase NagD (HAD superfamily)